MPRAQSPEHATGRTFADMPKVVFRRTLDVSLWPGTLVARGEIADEIGRQMLQPGS